MQNATAARPLAGTDPHVSVGAGPGTPGPGGLSQVRPQGVPPLRMRPDPVGAPARPTPRSGILPAGPPTARGSAPGQVGTQKHSKPSVSITKPFRLQVVARGIQSLASARKEMMSQAQVV